MPQGLTTEQLDSLEKKPPAAPSTEPSGLTTHQLDAMAVRHGGPQLDLRSFHQREATLAAAAHPLAGLLELLNRPNEATLAKVNHRRFFQTLLHGETPAQYDADTAATTSAMMGATPHEFAKLPAVRRAANEFATQMVTDPLTYLGGSGIMRKVVEEAGLHVLPAAMRVGQHVAQKTAATAMQDAFKLISESSGWLHDQITPGGRPVAHAIRELALRHGAEGMRQAERMASAASGTRGIAAHVAAIGKQLLDETLHGIAPQAQSQIFKAIHAGAIAKLPDELKPVADRLVQIDRSIPWLLGTKSMRAWLQQRGFMLPHELQVFDRGPRGVVTLRNFKEHHVPLPHEFDEQEREAAFRSLGREPGSRGLTDTSSPFFKRRPGEPPAFAFDDPAAIRDTWAHSFAAAGASLGAAQLRSDLINIFAQPTKERIAQLEQLGKRMRTGDLAGKPMTIDDAIDTALARPPGHTARLRTAVEQLRKTGAAPGERVLNEVVPQPVRAAFGRRASQESSPIQNLFRAAEKLGNLGKSTIFTTPLPHQRNIATLLALANPSTFPAAMAAYLRLGAGFAKPSTKAKVLGEAMHAGATGLPNVEQRDFTELLRKFGPLGKAASKWYGGVGQMLWGWDDAVKKALYERELKHFHGDAGRAAASVRRKIVDYSHTSPFQEAIRIVAPFATWRTAMPPAVLRSLLEHPEYGLGLNRATHGVAGGVPIAIGGKPYQSSNPLADVDELNPREYGKYVRSSTSLTSKAVADFAAMALRQKEMPFSKKQIESNVPIWGTVANPYGDDPLDRLLFTLTGLHPYAPPADERHHRYRRHRRHRPAS